METSRAGWLAVIQRQWRWLGYLAIFTISFIVLLVLQAAPVFSDPDSFYHAKMALLIRDQGIIHTFPWLNLTVLGQHYTDQHFLYHVLLIPFVTWFPPLVGLKLATVFFGAGVVTVAYWMMRQLGVRGAFLYALILLFSRPFSFRMSLAKAPSTSLIILLLGLTWIFQYRLRRLFWLAFVYVWYYGGFALLGIAAAVQATVSVLHNRCITGHDSHRFVQKIKALVGRHSRTPRVRRLNLGLLISVFGGLLAGIMINPYFPNNISFYYHQVINIGVINFQKVIGVGGEWYPYGLINLIANGAFASILLVLAIIGLLVRAKQQTKATWTLFILTVFFFFLTLKSRRYVEYYIPFAIIFSASSISGALAGLQLHRVWGEFRRLMLRQRIGQILLGLAGVYISLAAGFVAGRDFHNEQRDLQHGFRTDELASASAWLEANTPVGSRVVHSDWDEFPLLFYHNTHNTYIVGLDPTFLYKADQDRYWAWANITLGKFQGDVYRAVTTTLDSRYVMVTSDHIGMDSYFRTNDRFLKRYQDSEATIYEARR